MAAYVSSFRQHVAGELMLNTERPLVVTGNRRVVRVITRRLPVVRARISRSTDVVQRRIWIRKHEDGSYLVGLVQRSGAVSAQPFKAPGVRVDAPVVAVDAKSASHHPIVSG